MKAENENRAPAAAPIVFTLALALLISSLPFARLAQAKDQRDEKARPERAEIRLSVNETPIKREGGLAAGFAPIVKKVAPSVVNVFTTTKPKRATAPQSPLLDDPFFRRFFGGDLPGPGYQTPRQTGLGSGVVVTEDGYILTNNHVVENADEVKVAFTDGREYPAKVIGTDRKTDIAVLKVEASDLPHIQVANSDQLEVGDVVLAIGNPFGVGQTVTMGIVSATGRGNIGLDYEDFIQTDAAINPGNSGGGLIDAEGRLVGINTAILSRSGGSQGIGFAVPVNLARSVMESLVHDGRVVRGFMGVNIQNVTPALAREFKLKDTTGALVADVTPGSPAARAGLESGDVITEFNGRPVRDSRHLKLQAAQTRPETKVPLRVLRNGREKSLEVTLKEFPQDDLAMNPDKSPASSPERLKGVAVADIDETVRRQLKLPAHIRGALVSAVEEDSASYAAGLREGDVILELNRKPIMGAEDAVAMTRKMDDAEVLLKIWSRGGSRYLIVDESKAG